MKTREILLIILLAALLLLYIATVWVYSSKISDMRDSSSFKPIIKEEIYFKQCLDRSGIENKVEDGFIKIREVDSRAAISSCS